jgi:hypothetical protein
MVGGGGGGTAGGGAAVCSSHAARAKQTTSAGARIERRDRIEVISFSFVILFGSTRTRYADAHHASVARHAIDCGLAREGALACLRVAVVQPAGGVALAWQCEQSGRCHRPGRSRRGSRCWRRVRRDRLRGIRGLRRIPRRRRRRRRRIRLRGIRLRGRGRVTGSGWVARRVRARIVRIVARRVRAVGRRRRRGLRCAGVGRARGNDEERRPQTDDHGGCTH